MIMQKLFAISKQYCALPVYWRVLSALLALYAAAKMYQNVKTISLRNKRIQAGKIRRKAAETSKKSLLKKLNELIATDDSVLEKWASIVALDIGSLLAKLRSGELAPVEVLHAYQHQAMEATAASNCVTEPIIEAEEMARALEDSGVKGPLYGLPISVKENFYIKGYASTCGQGKFLLQPPPDRDMVLVAALKRLGAVPFAHTNVPQSLISYDCSNPIYGRTGNPVDPARTPGGSTGGEAALIRLNGSILGVGGDIAGSLRLPAHCSGVCSLKPTANRLSPRGTTAPLPGIQGIKGAFGFMGRDVSSVVTGMRAILSDAMFDEDASVPPLPFNDALYLCESPLHIGYYVDDGFYSPTPGVQRAVREAVDMMSAAGHHMVPLHTLPGANAYSLELACLGSDGGSAVAALLSGEPLDATLREFHSTISRPPWLRRLLGRVLGPLWPSLGIVLTRGAGARSVAEQIRLYAHRNEYVSSVLDTWRELGIQAMLCPVMPMPAPPVGVAGGIPVGVCYTLLYNMLDFPAGVVPVTTECEEDQRTLTRHYPPAGARTDPFYRRIKQATLGSVGLPIGVQCVAPPWREEVCLRVMRELEAAVVARRDAAVTGNGD